MESQLVSADQVPAAAQIIRSSLESGAEVVEVPVEATVRFRTTTSEADLSQVLRRLIQADVQVTQFREVQTDLEEAFMSFTRPQDSSKEKRSIAAGASAHA
jgi:ABC-2 type transport system ATP-binding protein